MSDARQRSRDRPERHKNQPLAPEPSIHDVPDPACKSGSSHFPRMMAGPAGADDDIEDNIEIDEERRLASGIRPIGALILQCGAAEREDFRIWLGFAVRRPRAQATYAKHGTKSNNASISIYSLLSVHNPPDVVQHDVGRRNDAMRWSATVSRDVGLSQNTSSSSSTPLPQYSIVQTMTEICAPPAEA